MLSSDREAVQREIVRCRQDEKAWPGIQYLWELHPILQWLNDKVVASFGRHEAPVIHLPRGLREGEIVFLLSGLVPNRKSHPLVHRWFGVSFMDGQFAAIEPFEDFLRRTRVHENTIPNPGLSFDAERLERLLPEAVDRGRKWMVERRDEFEHDINQKLNAKLNELEELRSRQHEQLELKFDKSGLLPQVAQARAEERRRSIDRQFDEYLEWIEDTMTTEKQPYLQVIAVFAAPGAPN